MWNQKEIHLNMDSARGYIQNIYQLAWQGHGALKLEEFPHRDLETTRVPGFTLLLAGLWWGVGQKKGDLTDWSGDASNAKIYPFDC